MRNFTQTKRIVIKVGTNILTRPDSVEIDSAYVRRIVRQINTLLSGGRQVLIVSSGAIGMGAGQLHTKKKTTNTKIRQAYAAIGQPLLMAEYKKAFARYDVTIAQILLTTEILNNRKTYLNLRNTVETLLRMNIMPVINENDSVSTDEIGTTFGDNDTLSALVASKINADLLIMLTDIDALYDSDPRKNKNAQPITTVFEITRDLYRSAGSVGSRHATGGMKTKLDAAKIAANAGCRMVLTNGRTKNIICRIIQGQHLGTLFLPKRKLSNRKNWILNSRPAGTIVIDDGALKAIARRKSLLPSGILSVKGSFDAPSVVLLNDKAKAVTNLNSSQLRMLAGKHSTEIRKQLGPEHRDVVAIPEDIVFIEY